MFSPGNTPHVRAHARTPDPPFFWDSVPFSTFPFRFSRLSGTRLAQRCAGNLNLPKIQRFNIPSPAHGNVGLCRRWVVSQPDVFQ